MTKKKKPQNITSAEESAMEGGPRFIWVNFLFETEMVCDLHSKNCLQGAFPSLLLPSRRSGIPVIHLSK